MSKQHLGLLFLLAALWGASFMFIRVAAPAFGPAPLVELRVALAGLFLLAWNRIARQRLRPVVPWPRYLLLGLLNAAAPFGLIATAELTLPAATAAILNATTPLFAPLGAAVFLQDRLTPRKAAGVLLGIVGVAVLVGFRFATRGDLLAALLSLSAALCYASGGIYGKHAFPGVPASTLAALQQLAAAAVMLPLAIWLHPTHLPSTAAAVSLLLLALACTAPAYLLYFRLLTEAGPTKTLSVTFLVPVFGALWGFVFLGERVGPSTLAGLVVILASVTLVTGLPFGRRAARDEASLAE